MQTFLRVLVGLLIVAFLVYEIVSFVITLKNNKKEKKKDDGSTNVAGDN